MDLPRARRPVRAAALSALLLGLPVIMLAVVERAGSRSPALLGLAVVFVLSTLAVVGGLARRFAS